MSYVDSKSHFKEITVERLNVVEPDGTLRMVISNRDSAPDSAVIAGGKFRKQKRAGLTFYNELGEECGGLGFAGRTTENGESEAGAAILFDQFQHDQIIGLSYSQSGMEKEYGFEIWERPNLPMTGPGAFVGDHRRMFIGRTSSGETAILLRDSDGNVRIRVLVDSNDVPKLEFLDRDGSVVYSLVPDVGTTDETDLRFD